MFPSIVASIAALAAPCPSFEADYDLSGKLTLSDTPHGQGDGTYDIGPGRASLRFDGNDVQLVKYTMHSSISVRARALFWKTTVATVADSSGAPDDRGVLAEGTFDGQRVHWRTPVRSYRTDGSMTCSGTFCGRFGAPPRGTSALHIGPAPQPFSDWVFAADGKSFTMPRTQGPRTDMPKQSSAVSVVGHETSRTCR